MKNIILTYWFIGFFFSVGFMSEFPKYVASNLLENILMFIIMMNTYPLFIGMTVARFLAQ